MIFSLKQGMYTAVLLGDKTLTTRLKLPAHIAKGKEWAIVPGRAKPAWWISGGLAVPSLCTQPREEWRRLMADASEYIDIPTFKEFERYLLKHDYVRAAIHIETFYAVELQDMTHSEALREGVGTVEEYAALWDRINDKKGVRWADNPTVHRVSFHLPDDVSAAVSRVGRQVILQAAGQSTELETVTP